MKVGDRVRCVKNMGSLTFGKIYKVENVCRNGDIKLEDDEGYWVYCSVKHFELAEEFEHRFKIGDKVRAKSNMYKMHCNKTKNILTKGKVYTILTIAETNEAVEILADTRVKEWVGIDWLELVDEFEPTKSYLLKHNNEYVYERKIGDIKHIYSLLGYNEDLTDDEGKSQFNIEKIYKWENGNLILVWERDTRRELTIEEAEKEFNIKIKGETNNEQSN